MNKAVEMQYWKMQDQEVSWWNLQDRIMQDEHSLITD